MAAGDRVRVGTGAQRKALWMNSVMKMMVVKMLDDGLSPAA